MPNITNRILDSAQPKSLPYSIRDNRFKGFAVKINPSGSRKFIVEVWHEGKSVRKTLGEYPITCQRRPVFSFQLRYHQPIRLFSTCPYGCITEKRAIERAREMIDMEIDFADKM